MTELQSEPRGADTAWVAMRPNPGAVRVLIADDQALFAEGLLASLASDERIDVVGVARDGRESVELVEELQPDLVLMDLQMPVMDGLEATRLIRSLAQPTQVIMLTGVGTGDDARAALAAGAAGFVRKERMASELIEHFHEVAMLALVFGTLDRPTND